MYNITLIIAILIISTNISLALPGSGTQEDPYYIKSFDDFNEFTTDPNYWDDYIRLETDVNLAGCTYTKAVVAPDVNHSQSEISFQGTAFTGVFDGNGHKIKNLTIDDDNAGHDFLGLFGRVENGELRNLGLEGGSIRGRSVVGGLVGNLDGWDIRGSTISNCYSACDVVGKSDVGGLVGLFGRGKISNSYSTGSVKGTDFLMPCVGGLVGRNYDGDSSVTNCFSTGDVSGVAWTGGLMGSAACTVSQCYSTGSVKGEDVIGGLLGKCGKVTNCYSTGPVTGKESVGGLVGVNSGKIVNSYSIGSVSWNRPNRSIGGLVGDNLGSCSNCFWNVETSGIMDQNESGTGKTTEEMKNISTYLDAGWDLVGENENGTSDVWVLQDGTDYPRLRGKTVGVTWEKAR